MKRGDIYGYLGLALLAGALLVRILFEGSANVSLGLGAFGAALFIVYFFMSGSRVRGFLDRKSTREGGNVLGAVTFVLGILILVNLLAARFEKWKDFTSDRLFSPAAETITALNSAPHAVRVWGFFPSRGHLEAEFRLLMDGIRMEFPELDVRYVDPDREPSMAHEFNITQYGTVVEIGSRREFYLGLREVDFLTAVRRASIQRSLKVGFLGGQGEITGADSSPGGLREAAVQLVARGYETYNINLQRGDSLDSLDVLIMARQQYPLEPGDLQRVLSFSDAGGHLLLLLDPSTGLDQAPILERWGLRFTPRFIVDAAQREPQVIVAQDVSSHPVTGFLIMSGVTAVFPGAGEVKRIEGGLAAARSKYLMWSSGQARTQGIEGDTPTQRALAAVAAKPDPEGGETRLAVFGDSDFASTRYFNVLGNGDLFLSAVKWLSGSQETIALAPRSRTDRPLVISRQQGRALTVLFSVIVPAAVLGAGVAAWWRRR